MLRGVTLILSLILASGGAAETRYVAPESGTAILAGPGTSYRSVGRLPTGARVEIRQTYEGYALFRMANGVEAWLRSSALRARPPAPAAAAVVPVTAYPSVVWTKSGPLNMRAGPGLAHTVLGQCQRGDWVEVIAKAGPWSEVRLPDGAQGWVYARYLTR